MRGENRFLLLQINDALFPIGGYSHSYGLETYIQNGMVCDEKSAREFVLKKVLDSFLYNEFLSARMAFEFARAGELAKIEELEEIVEAGKVPYEIRMASRKLGSRFVKTLGKIEIIYENDIFKKYAETQIGFHHAVAYGVFCAAAGFELEEALQHFLYAQTSSMITNCVKSIPLSQTVGQKILNDSYPILEKTMKKVMKLENKDLGMSCPGFDIRCMQHEALYSRIYMS